MKATKIAERYAKAFLQWAIDEGTLEEVHEEMIGVAQEVKENKDLRVLLNSPVIRTEKKLNVLDKFWGERLGASTMEMIRHVCRKDREMYLRNIAERFVTIYKTHKNIVTAEVRTAVPMDEELRQAVLEKVRSEKGQEVDLIEKVDPELIGGILLKVGDRQYDGSVLKQLRKLRAAYRA